jgi:hypothetical protein
LGVATVGRCFSWILISSSTNLRFFASVSVPAFKSPAAIAIGQKAGTLIAARGSDPRDVSTIRFFGMRLLV